MSDTPERPQCRAKSKQSQQRCKRRPSPNKELCVMHGSKTEGVSATHRVTHGQTSKFFTEQEALSIADRMRQLDTPEGRAEAVKKRYAINEARSERIPDGVEHLELALKAEDRLVKAVGLIEEMERGSVAAIVPTYIIAQTSMLDPVTVRTLDGQAPLIEISGVPHLHDPARGGWFPASKHIDDDSKAEFYEFKVSTH